MVFVDFAAANGVRLREVSALRAWERAARERIAGRPAGADWFIALEVLSDPRPDVRRRGAPTVKALAAYLETSAGAVYDGALKASGQKLRVALGQDPTPRARSHQAMSDLYLQARMATFLSYRDGFVRFLSGNPISAELAIHAYVRIVLEWASRWRGLTRATEMERRHRDEPLPGKTTSEDQRAGAIALPAIVAADVDDLMRLLDHETGALVSPAEGEERTERVLWQLSHAIAFLVEDPTLSIEGAAGHVSGELDRIAGGPPARRRVSQIHSRLAIAEAVTELRELMLARGADIPMSARVDADRVDRLLAEVRHALSATPGVPVD